MTIIDSQVHVYEANTPKRPWHSVPNWPDHVTGDEMVAAMDKVGVDGAIFISAFSMYQYDASYAVEVQRAHPGRFRSEEHTSELQSLRHLVCRLLLEKKKKHEHTIQKYPENIHRQSTL